MTRSDGKTPDDDSGIDDNDIAALLNTGNDTVPTFLDQRILAAAREAVASDDATTTASTPTPPVAARSPSHQRWQARSRWMAMAACLILAVTVAPLMLRSPETRLDNRDSAAEQSTLKAVQESVTFSSDMAAPQAEPRESQAGLSLLREPASSEAPSETPTPTPEATRTARPPTPRALSPEHSPLVPAIRAQKRSTLSERAAERATDSEALSSADESLTDTEFRSTPQTWAAHIRQLQKDERYDEAITEYRLFRRLYPAYEPGFTTPLRQ